MKSALRKTILLLGLISFYITGFAQSPLGFKYQAVVRDADGLPRTDELIAIDIQIHQSTETGTVVFTEPHAPLSDQYGLITLVIGSQNPVDFKNIDWANGPYYLKVSVDGIEMGTTELMSVPYSLYSQAAG